MNISYRWLRAVAPSIADGPRDLADRLAMLGAPVDEVVELGAGIGGVVVARVAEVRQHPNADRLRLCMVEAGTGEALQVVCGAPNVEAGRYYPFAPVGASLPGGLEIRRAKLRGEVSEGMLCSARELGLGRDHEGIMALHGDWEPGTPFVEALGLDDVRLVVDVTANRPDLLSHLGVARELAPGGAAALRLPDLPGATGAELEIRGTDASAEVAGVRVAIDDVEGCPRYLGAVLRGVRVAPSPEWLASRLRAVGLRPINNVVDATNYVLLEVGQPLHAFDLAKLGGEVRVRRAMEGERIRTLDGVDRSLQAHMLVIADGRRPVAVAGVMGGEETEVDQGTTDLFLECALFEPKSVRRAARALGLSTDSSYRFERGVDPAGQPSALRRLVELILAVAGGEIDGAAADLHPVPAAQRVVELRVARVGKLLGFPVAADRIAEALGEIGFQVDASGEPIRVTVPGYRPDVAREIDLVEELARRIGYATFPEEFLPFRPSAVPQDPLVPVAARLRERFRGLGFLESRTVGFAPAAEGRVPLLNPLSAEESHLRDALAPGLLRRVEHNWARGTRDVRLFEIGTVFRPGGEDGRPREEVRVAAAATGLREPAHWTGTGAGQVWDVWDIKELLAGLAAELGGGEPVPADEGLLDAFTEAGTRLSLHGAADGVNGSAGRAADVAIDAPAWAEPVWLMEVSLPAASVARSVEPYRAIPEQPPIERDLALVTPTGVGAAEVSKVIHASAGELLESIAPFDVYVGAGIPEGTSSVAWRLRFRAPERTLTDAEVDPAVASVLRALEEQLGVRRR
jgi:phenylalanyl-tRNA synthetase beta chain